MVSVSEMNQKHQSIILLTSVLKFLIQIIMAGIKIEIFNNCGIIIDLVSVSGSWHTAPKTPIIPKC